MTSIRLHVTSEGQTEERFVKKILAPHLGAFNVFADVRSVLTRAWFIFQGIGVARHSRMLFV